MEPVGISEERESLAGSGPRYIGLGFAFWKLLFWKGVLHAKT
jgi:hypothetical protein